MDDLTKLMKATVIIAQTVQSLQRAGGPLQFDRAMRRLDAVVEDLEKGIKEREAS